MSERAQALEAALDEVGRFYWGLERYNHQPFREAMAKLRALLAEAPPVGVSPQPLTADDVEWVVNDNAELGVKIGQQFFFCYKGHSLVYMDGTHDDGKPMMWRPVFKREFGECIHPVNYREPSRIGTVSLDDSDDWKPLSASLSPVEPTPLTEQFMVDALAAAVADRDHSDAQLAAIEAVVRQELCPIENSESQGDDEPEPRYICMSEDGDRIIEADDIPGVIRQVVARWDAAGKRCEAAKAALETIKSAPVEPTPEPPTEKIPDAELDAVLAGVYADRRPAPTGAPAPCVWRPVREGSAWLKPTCRDFALSFLPAKAHEFAGCPYCLKPLTVER